MPLPIPSLPSDERPKRAVISCEDIKRIQKVCLSLADERRLLISLISDTGIRLSEAHWVKAEDGLALQVCNKYSIVKDMWNIVENKFYVRGMVSVI